MTGPAWRPSAVIAAMCAAEILSMTGYAAFPALTPVFARSWQLTATQIGWIGAAFFAGTAMGTALLPAATDRLDARALYLASLGLGVFGLLSFAVADGPAGAAASRFVQGVGLAGTYFPGLRALLAALPAAHHGRATAFYTGLYAVGTSLSFFLTGVLNAQVQHHATFALLGLGPAIAMPIAALTLRPGAPRGDAAAPLFQFAPVLRDRLVRGHVAAYAALCGQILVLQTWLVLLLARGVPGRGDDAALSSTIAAGIALCAVPASIFGNELAERYGQARVIVAVMLASLVLFIATFAAVQAPLWALVLIALALFSTTTLNSASITNSLRARCVPEYLGRALSVYALAGAVAAMAAPFAFGVMLDLAGGVARPLAWFWAALAVGAGFLGGPIAFARTVGDGLARSPFIPGSKGRPG